MTRGSAFLALAALLAATSSFAQDSAADLLAKLNVVLPRTAEENLALSAAPEHLRAGAAVYAFGARGYEKVRAGTNGFTCLVNRDSFFHRSSSLKPTCWDAQGESTFVPVMLKVGEMLAARESEAAIRKAIEDGFATKQFRAPDAGGVAYMLAGDVEVDARTGQVTRQVFPGHYMFYANKATNTQLGFTPEAAKKDPTLPVIASAGAGGAQGLTYIIAVPGNMHKH